MARGFLLVSTWFTKNVVMMLLYMQSVSSSVEHPVGRLLRLSCSLDRMAADPCVAGILGLC